MDKKTASIIPAAVILGVTAMLALAAANSSVAGPLINGFIETVPVLPPDQTLQLPERAYDQQLTAMEWTAWAALAAALCGFLSMLIIFWTLLTTRDMLREAKAATDAAQATITTTREIGEAQVRCYPTIDDIIIAWPNGIQDPYISVKWRNAGNSPAILPEITVRATFSEYNCNTDQTIHRTADASYPLHDAPAQSQSMEVQLPRIAKFCVPSISHDDLSYLDLLLEVCLFSTDVFGAQNAILQTCYVEAHVNRMLIQDTDSDDGTAWLPPDLKQRLIREHRSFSQHYG